MAKMRLSARNWLVLILVSQMILICGFELAHDEAYYWLFSKNLDWGYFDHPPMVAVIIRLFSFLPHSEFSVRIGFLLLQYLTVEVLWKLVAKENHLKTLLLFFAFPLASLSGLFALPDMALLFMSSLYCYFLKDFLENKKNAVWGLSVVIPLLLYSKYQGILLLLFTILALPRILLRKDFWIVTVISLLLFSPHVWWQYQHDFPTLKYHFLERPKSGFNVKRLFEYLVLQVGLAGILMGPLIWYSVLKYKSMTDFQKAMKWISIGVTLFFFLSSFSKKFEANWTIFLAVPLILLFISHPSPKIKVVNFLLGFSFALTILAKLLLVLPIENVSKRLTEFKNWGKWSLELKDICGPDGMLLANTYQIASKLSFYTKQNVHALNFKSRKNQFDLWPQSLDYQGRKTCYLTDKNEFSGESIETPQGKKLKLITDQKIEQLNQFKELFRSKE